MEKDECWGLVNSFPQHKQEFPSHLFKRQIHVTSDKYNTVPEYIEEIHVTDNFSLGESLLKVYPLMDLIFENLYWTELVTASEVCQAWKEVAERTMLARKRIKKPGFQVCSETEFFRSNNFYYYEYDFSIAVQYISSSTTVVKHSIKKSIPNYVREEICQRNCHITSTYQDTCLDVPICRIIFLCVALPKINGIRFREFVKWKCIESEEVRDDEKILAFHLFAGLESRTLKRTMKNFYDRFRDRMGENFAFTGGVLNVKGGRGPGFLIIEDPATSNLGFLAFSLVATEDDDFEALISNFKEQVPPRDNVVVLLSQCYGRTDGDTNMKFLIQYFPNVVVLSTLVGGEFGINSNIVATRKYNVQESLAHCYCFSLMFLMWNNKPIK